MGSFSRIAILATACLALAGCWTGRLYERGRVGESVLTYQSAAMSGEQLVVEYSVERSNWKGRPIGRGVRVAAIPLAALDALPEHPVDAFPLERIGSLPTRTSDQRQVPIVEAGSRPAKPITAPFLEVLAVDGRHDGFRVCGPPRGECHGRFRSLALYRNTTAWWVYPFIPISAALDAALFVPQIVGQSPFFLLGE